jgi:hypothetical protein
MQTSFPIPEPAAPVPSADAARMRSLRAWTKSAQTAEVTPWKRFKARRYSIDVARGTWHVMEMLQEDGKRAGWATTLNTHEPNARGYHWETLPARAGLRDALQAATDHEQSLPRA